MKKKKKKDKCIFALQLRITLCHRAKSKLDKWNAPIRTIHLPSWIFRIHDWFNLTQNAVQNRILQFNRGSFSIYHNTIKVVDNPVWGAYFQEGLFIYLFIYLFYLCYLCYLCYVMLFIYLLVGGGGVGEGLLLEFVTWALPIIFISFYKFNPYLYISEMHFIRYLHKRQILRRLFRSL